MIFECTAEVKAWMRQRRMKPIGVWIFLIGMAMTLGFVPFNLWPVGVMSLACLWWLVTHADSKRQVAGAAFVWGLGHGVTALYWLPWAFFKDSDGSWAEAIGGGVPTVVGLAVYGALPYMIASVLAWQAGRKLDWNRAGVVWMLLLVGFEFLKGLHPMGFPWLPVGAMFANMPILSLTAALGGVWLLSACGIGMAVLLGNGRKETAVGILGILACMMAWGFWWEWREGPKVAVGGDLIRVVQPNITTIGKWETAERLAVLKQTLDVALATPPSSTIPRTVILPETAVAFYLDEEEDVRAAIAQRLAASLPADAALVTGTIRREAPLEGQTMPRFYNSLTVMDTSGKMRGMYDKRFLVPFGEYIPARNWIEKLPLPMPLRTLSQSRIDFTHGVRSPLLPTPEGYALGLICYEGIFPLQVAEAAGEARYMVNVSNDGWFTGTIALYQHAALTRLRAIEAGLPMVRVTNTGLTLVYDGLGREKLRLPINVATHADVKLPPPLPGTPFLTMVNLVKRL